MKSTSTIKLKSIFDHLNDITFNKNSEYFDNLTEKERKDYSIFMIQRYLSMEKGYTNGISYIDKYAHNCLSKEMYHKLVSTIIPKSKVFLKYIKKDKTEKKNNLVIEYLAKRLEISKAEAESNLQFLSDKDKEILLQGYGIDEKTIKKELY